MDLAVEEPLSPVLHPPRQTMHSHDTDSASDGDEVMGTAIASPHSQVELASEWALLDRAAGNHPGANQLLTDLSEPSEGTSSAPSWGQVLGNLKTWGITPASQSAAASPLAAGKPSAGMKSDNGRLGLSLLLSLS